MSYPTVTTAQLPNEKGNVSFRNPMYRYYMTDTDLVNSETIIGSILSILTNALFSEGFIFKKDGKYIEPEGDFKKMIDTKLMKFGADAVRSVFMKSYVAYTIYTVDEDDEEWEDQSLHGHPYAHVLDPDKYVGIPTHNEDNDKPRMKLEWVNAKNEQPIFMMSAGALCNSTPSFKASMLDNIKLTLFELRQLIEQRYATGSIAAETNVIVEEQRAPTQATAQQSEEMLVDEMLTEMKTKKVIENREDAKTFRRINQQRQRNKESNRDKETPEPKSPWERMLSTTTDPNYITIPPGMTGKTYAANNTDPHYLENRERLISEIFLRMGIPFEIHTRMQSTVKSDKPKVNRDVSVNTIQMWNQFFKRLLPSVFQNIYAMDSDGEPNLAVSVDEPPSDVLTFGDLFIKNKSNNKGIEIQLMSAQLTDPSISYQLYVDGVITLETFQLHHPEVIFDAPEETDTNGPPKKKVKTNKPKTIQTANDKQKK